MTNQMARKRTLQNIHINAFDITHYLEFNFIAMKSLSSIMLFFFSKRGLFPDRVVLKHSINSIKF